MLQSIHTQIETDPLPDPGLTGIDPPGQIGLALVDGNLLYYGDNLDVLREHIGDETVDLVYLDPPFKSNQDYNVLFAEHGVQAPAQIKAFEDTWRWDKSAAATYDEVVTEGGRVADAMVAFRKFLGDNDMLAYLSMMAPRLMELRRVLKPTGSIYLHADPTASHYLKMLMDSIFGATSFQNEIVWYYRGGGVSKGRFGRRHDILLYYTRGTKHTFNVDAVRTGLTGHMPHGSGVPRFGIRRLF